MGTKNEVGWEPKRGMGITVWINTSGVIVANMLDIDKSKSVNASRLVERGKLRSNLGPPDRRVEDAEMPNVNK